MTAHNNLNRLLLHNVHIAPDIRDAATLQERTERSLDLAKSFCHGRGSHPSDVSWSFIEYILGGDTTRKSRSVLSDEHSMVIDRVENTRSQLRRNVGQLVSRVELRVPLHHTYPVLRAVWVGTLGQRKPNYELRPRGTNQFAVTMSTTVKNPHTGIGPLEHRYFGDSSHVAPLEKAKNTHSITTYGFILSESGIETSNEQYPALLYGRDALVSVVGRKGLDSTDEKNLIACLDQIESHREQQS